VTNRRTAAIPGTVDDDDLDGVRFPQRLAHPNGLVDRVGSDAVRRAPVERDGASAIPPPLSRDLHAPVPRARVEARVVSQPRSSFAFAMPALRTPERLRATGTSNACSHGVTTPASDTLPNDMLR
jgi:hypothetical protein